MVTGGGGLIRGQCHSGAIHLYCRSAGASARAPSGGGGGLALGSAAPPWRRNRNPNDARGGGFGRAVTAVERAARGGGVCEEGGSEFELRVCRSRRTATSSLRVITVGVANGGRERGGAIRTRPTSS